MNPMIIACFTACCIAVSVAILAIIVCVSIRDYYDIKRTELEIKLKEIETRPLLIDYTKNLQYSKDIMEFVRTIVAQEAVLYFRNFADGHIMNKVTLSQMKKLVADVANRVESSLKRTSIDFNKTIFDEKFYNHYIIECSKDYVKQLLEKQMVDIVTE